MICPIDQSPLEMSERSGIEIDYCPTCRGVWLDRGELDKLIERLQVAELLLRLSRDKRLISNVQYAKAVELTQSVGKQAGGWRKSALRPLHDGQGRHG